MSVELRKPRIGSTDEYLPEEPVDYSPSGGGPGNLQWNANSGPGLPQYSQPQTPTNNPGAPGSPTAAINSQWKKDGDPWVDTGETGGSLNQRTTIGQGRSTTPEAYKGFMDQARAAGYSDDYIADFEKRNPGDMHRFLEGQAGDGEGSNDSAAMGYRMGGMGGGQDDWLKSALRSLGTNGAMNQDILNRRVDNQRDVLNQNRKSQTASNNARLAERGLIGDGPQSTAMGNLETRLGEGFNSAVNEIYADESQNADDRMMQALTLSTGLSQSEAQNLIDMFRANTERDLGTGRLNLDTQLGYGNLALGNLDATNSYNLGLDTLGQAREFKLADLDAAQIDRVIKLLDQGLTLQQIIDQGWI